MTWALIAHSAIDGDCSGIMAASEDICDHIAAEGGSSGLFIFPDNFNDPGFFLWEGTMEQALSGEGGKHTEVMPGDLARWIDANGDPA